MNGATKKPTISWGQNWNIWIIESSALGSKYSKSMFNEVLSIQVAASIIWTRRWCDLRHSKQQIILEGNGKSVRFETCQPNASLALHPHIWPWIKILAWLKNLAKCETSKGPRTPRHIVALCCEGCFGHRYKLHMMQGTWMATRGWAQLKNCSQIWIISKFVGKTKKIFENTWKHYLVLGDLLTLWLNSHHSAPLICRSLFVPQIVDWNSSFLELSQ